MCNARTQGDAGARVDSRIDPKTPHDAQVRRISWVRGVGRPALAHSGLLVPLPYADRPPFFAKNDVSILRQAAEPFGFSAPSKQKRRPKRRRFL
jgi:hypothetical protein